jgi:hypothetical protein
VTYARQVLIMVFAIFFSPSAFADAIDGDWCSTSEAKQFRIEGPIITTPAGTPTAGDYTRHASVYVVPEGDPSEGDAIAIRLLNDDEVRVAVNEGEPEIWRRCKLIS